MTDESNDRPEFDGQPIFKGDHISLLDTIEAKRGVPKAQLRELVDQWRDNDHKKFTPQDMERRKCADELEELIE